MTTERQVGSNAPFLKTQTHTHTQRQAATRLVPLVFCRCWWKVTVKRPSSKSVYACVCVRHVGWFPVPTQQRGSLAFLCACIKGHGEPPILRLDFTSCHPGLVLIKAPLFLWEHRHMFHTRPLSPTLTHTRLNQRRISHTKRSIVLIHSLAHSTRKASIVTAYRRLHLHINTRWSCLAGAPRSPIHTMRKSTHRS